ncbi:hypothetical protein [endosymbiont GvMRE of Glomus versiforme]|uniref:hypothetical protein n=1 Tax=endosymbiont GvMRE of Glomus versiforme TaxID=2039283 RepID=UPI0011C438D8|nr:hypothetical protein [endosymbiont GvMRE of Glomus versiforme]
MEKKERELRKRLEAKNKEANCLKKDVEEFLELLKKIDKQRDEVLFLAKDFKEIAHDFHKAHKEIYELYLNTKTQHREYIERMIKSFKKFWETCCEIVCNDCLTKFEFILKNREHLGETKKLT